jgi:hypothetical protein
LKYTLDKKIDQFGNAFRYRAKVNPNDSDSSPVDRKAYDVFFVTETPDSVSKIVPKSRPLLSKTKAARNASGS